MTQALDKRAARRLQRDTSRLQAEVPLLLATGVVDTPTMDDARQAVRRSDDSLALHFMRLEAFRAQQEADAVELRALVQQLVTPDEFRAIDERTAAYPRDATSLHADYWNNTLARLKGMTPLEMFNERERRRQGSEHLQGSTT